MKKFYKSVSIQEIDQGYSICLDGKAIKTQNKNLLFTKKKNLADLIVKEWDSQGEDIKASYMYFTQFLGTAIDYICIQRNIISEKLMNFLNTDLLCFRTTYPADLANRQETLWDPWIKWFDKEAGVELKVTRDLIALEQPGKAIAYVGSVLEKLDDNALTICHFITTLSGSIILGLAFIEGKISPEEVLEIINVEDNYKAEVYNEAHHGRAPHVETKLDLLKAELAASEQYLQATR
jgi:chaperone required for assembly of F1-ATPase